MDLEKISGSVWEQKALQLQNNMREKVNSSSDLYALGKTLQALAGKNWLSVLWKVPGFALFLYKCTRPQGKRRFENAAQARKMLSGIGKRKGLARKKMQRW